MKAYVLSALGSVVVAIFATRPRRARRSFVDAVDGRRRHPLEGPALHRYLVEGGPAGALGSPVSGLRRATSDPDTPLGADREVAFANGTVYVDSSTGLTTILMRCTTTVTP